ncbi:hypothetical protein G4228_010983 [Cervus hanglu yarkandensis]|nr:hypothetical protein G4228_010983 [Cervus hanglu yarkandensis]
MANMDSDSRHLLITEVDNEINPGPMNIQFDSSDIRSKMILILYIKRNIYEYVFSLIFDILD